jgi:two-component system, chemotaxis family, chemotaxis protein CheY
MRCLVVDDDETCRKFIIKVMERIGHCDIALTGKEAIELVTKSFGNGDLYDVIFLDIMMPVMDGKQALSAIRVLERRAGLQDGWGSKIVMTTAMGDYDTVRQAFHNQCDGYLVKPLSISRMEALLRNLKVLSANVSLRRNDDSESAAETPRGDLGQARPRPAVSPQLPDGGRSP